MVIWAFYCVHVVKSIPWTVIGHWPRNGHISVCVYIYVYIYILACLVVERGLY